MLKRVKSGTCCLQTEKKKGTTLSTELDRATSPRRTSPGLHTEEKHWMNLWGCGKITDFSFVSFSGQWIPYIKVLHGITISFVQYLFQSMTYTDTIRPLNCLSHLGSYKSKSNSGQSPLQQTILSTDVDFETDSVAD